MSSLWLFCWLVSGLALGCHSSGGDDPSDGISDDGGAAGNGGTSAPQDALDAAPNEDAAQSDVVVFPEYRVEPAPPPFREKETELPISGRYPGKLVFERPEDLTAKLFLRKGLASVTSDEGGALRVERQRSAAFVFDSEPDGQRSDVFRDFTASIRYRAIHTPAVWFTFAGDKNRNDALQVSFRANKGKVGPPGTTDVDSLHFCAECWSGGILPPNSAKGLEAGCEAGNSCGVRKSEIYAWTYLDPKDDWVTFKITVKASAAAVPALKVRADLYQGDDWVDGQSYTYQLLYRTAGEVGFGITAAGSDVLVDAVELKAPEAYEDEPLHVSANGAATLWLPTPLRGKGKVKGVLTVEPGLSSAGVGAASLYEHLRRFATAHDWALASTSRSQEPAKFLAGLAELAATTMHAELTSVPLFSNSLLSPFPHDTHVDPAAVSRLMGFFADKMTHRIDASDQPVPIATSTEAGRNVPGFYSYADNSLIANRGSVEPIFREGRTKGATWGLINHNDQTHAVVDSWVFYLPFLQELMVLRKPNSQGQMPALNPGQAQSQLGEIPGILLRDKYVPDVLAISEVPEAMRSSYSFLPGPETAAVYQAFHYYRPYMDPQTNRIVIVDGKRVFDPKRVYWKRGLPPGKAGETRRLELGFAEAFAWSKAEVYEIFQGVHKRKDLTPADDPSFDTAALAAGAHTFIAKIWDAQGKLHITHPVVAIMAP